MNLVVYRTLQTNSDPFWSDCLPSTCCCQLPATDCLNRPWLVKSTIGDCFCAYNLNRPWLFKSTIGMPVKCEASLSMCREKNEWTGLVEGMFHQSSFCEIRLCSDLNKVSGCYHVRVLPSQIQGVRWNSPPPSLKVFGFLDMREFNFRLFSPF